MRLLRIFLLLFALALTLTLGLLSALWIWSGKEGSLDTTLHYAASFLPADQVLVTQGVTGSVRYGGRIAQLQWHQGARSIKARDIQLNWSWRALLDGTLQIDQLALTHLQIEDRSPPTDPPEPPQNLRLPFKVQAAFAVGTLEWVGPPALKANGLSGRYHFDSNNHSIDAGQVQISNASYTFNAQLHATAPLALSAQVDGLVRNAIGLENESMDVVAHAFIGGILSQRNGTLQLEVELTPRHPGTQAAMRAIQAQLDASIQPWQPQPLQQAKASWMGLNLAALWPQAPQTQLSGAASVTPDGTHWRAQLDLTNTLSGPWDTQRLPVEQASAILVYTGEHWQLQTLQAHAAQGRIQARGQLAAAIPAVNTPSLWDIQASVQGINPAALDTRLSTASLGGRVSAQQSAAGIGFDVHLLTTPTSGARQRTAPVLDLKVLQAKGHWAAPRLQLSELRLHANGAQLEGQAVLDTADLGFDGQLALVLPGAQVSLNGSLSELQGQGETQVLVHDAQAVARWIARLPGLGPSWADLALRGTLQASAHWRGGWQNQGRTIQLRVSASSPELELSLDPAAPMRLHQWKAQAQGKLEALTLALQGRIKTPSADLRLQTQARAGWKSEGAWQAHLDSARVDIRSEQAPGPWTLELVDAVTLNLTQKGQVTTIDIAPGSLHVLGPTSDVSALSWERTEGVQRKTDTSMQWRTAGRMDPVPLAWFELFGQTRLANFGLSGDMRFALRWAASSFGTPSLSATLERTSGDVRLQAETTTAPSLAAQVREAWVQVSLQDGLLQAKMQWDSLRAGQAQAEFNTQLSQLHGKWGWPAQAPVTGKATFALPPIELWSVLAPPGWRLRGTLGASVLLSGTRAQPQWLGSLAAQDLAVRSVVDGIDFSGGRLRASITGQTLTVDEFIVRGAGGASGGLLAGSGTVDWIAGGDDIAQSLRMEFRAQAKALRVSARPDRRLAVSGNFTLRSNGRDLSVRGNLAVDRALFIVPEYSTVKLGDDVVVRPGSSKTAHKTLPSPPPRDKTPPRQIDLALTLDLGPDFQVRGRGLSTRLAGTLTLRHVGTAAPPTLSGTLNAVQGTYKAYGQFMKIEQGLLRFTGPYDNPALDILAIRPNLPQTVGVLIRGTVLAPVVQLYAEPDLPESEKLAWLVLGRSSAGGGAEAMMLQQAALALLGGSGGGPSSNLIQALGLDELSVSGASGSNDSASGATVTLGKRVSRDFYLAYERSLAGTVGSLYIFYDLSRRFTLRAQAGERSAVDLIFTLPYD